MPRGGSNLSSFLFSAELENIGHVSYLYYELEFPSYSRLPKEGLLGIPPYYPRHDSDGSLFPATLSCKTCKTNL